MFIPWPEDGEDAVGERRPYSYIAKRGGSGTSSSKHSSVLFGVSRSMNNIEHGHNDDHTAGGPSFGSI